MGLAISHDAFRAPYSAFGNWRRDVAKAMGINLDTMQGYGGNTSWKGKTKGYPGMYVLLIHSDCQGYIGPNTAAKIADSLEKLAPKMDKDPYEAYGEQNRTQRFIRGCRAAAQKKERLEFY